MVSRLARVRVLGHFRLNSEIQIIENMVYAGSYRCKKLGLGAGFQPASTVCAKCRQDGGAPRQADA